MLSVCARLGGEVAPPLGVVVEEVAVLVGRWVGNKTSSTQGDLRVEKLNWLVSSSAL